MLTEQSRLRLEPYCVPLVRRCCVMAAVVILPCMMSCTGGGGSGVANFQTNPNTGFLASVAEPSAPAVAGDWSGSAEYANSTGLAQLKAAEGYARRSGGLPGGQGVRIAIIDSGVDVTHPDLGNLAATSWSAGGEALIGDSHATFVAGIAGASRSQSSNPDDMHGMAYRATLVNFQASRPSDTLANGGVSFATGDLVDAIRTASGLTAGSSAVSSDILNLSLGASSGNDSTFAALRTAMRAAADEDRIMVLAAGNEGSSGNPADRLQPIYPAAYADDSGIAGLAIAVGNLTSSNQAAASSSFCGDVRDYCLFAPGTAIRSTVNGGAYGVGSGTSFAAPYVAGAAAVVKAAFPGVSSWDVVDRLLLTAADLGAAGVDSTFGRGRLDLEAAMAPVGPTGFPIGPTVDDGITPLEGSALQLGPGLALNADANRLLSRVMAIDSMGFPFAVDLNEAVNVSEIDDGLSAFLSGDGGSVVTTDMERAEISAFISKDGMGEPVADFDATSLEGQLGDDQHLPLGFAADISDSMTVFASLNAENPARLGLGAGLEERRAALFGPSRYLSPYAGLTSTLSGAGFSVRPMDGMEVALSAFTSMSETRGGRTAMQHMEFMQALPGNVEMRLGLGFIQQDGGFVGSTANGVFGDESSSRSQVLTVALLGPLAEDIDWFTTWSHGRASIGDAGQGIFTRWSDTRSKAFGAGLVISDLAADDDGLTIAIGQPVRQSRAKATVEVPIARTTDGQVVTVEERLDFAPDAREIAMDLGYRLPLDDDGLQDIRAAGFLRLSPDHDADRKPEAGLGLVYRWRF